MEEVKRNSLKAWLLAARPKTLTGAITPVLIGTALAAMDGRFHWLPALVCCLFAGLMQIAANFINDLFDFLKGIAVTVTLACLIGCTLLLFAGWELIIIGALCVLFAFLYTTGPYPLSYNGWGDVLVIIFFGFVPVGGTYYVQALTWTPDVTIASIICGLLIDTLLVVNNYRDREADARSGKRTVIVRFGEKFGRYFYLLLGISASLLCLYFLREGHIYAALLPQLYLVPHVLTWRRMVKIHSGKKLNSILGETSRNMLFMGILLAIGMIL